MDWQRRGTGTSLIGLEFNRNSKAVINHIHCKFSALTIGIKVFFLLSSLCHMFLCCTDGHLSVLVVGLGGGGLPQFIWDFVPGVRVDVVELDPAVLEVAKTWFGFQTDDRLKVILGDGLKHISMLESKGKVLFYKVL